jgi:NAD(P)H-hydrate repair Nnr-like enzyme with NAD(P)H-hydrate dehydratase domain
MIAAALAQINVAGPEDVDGDEEARGRVASVRDRLRLVAIITAVYLHGLAGDIAARALGMRAMLASDLIEHIGPAMRELNAAREDRFAWIGRLDRTTPTIE